MNKTVYIMDFTGNNIGHAILKMLPHAVADTVTEEEYDMVNGVTGIKCKFEIWGDTIESDVTTVEKSTGEENLLTVHVNGICIMRQMNVDEDLASELVLSFYRYGDRASKIATEKFGRIFERVKKIKISVD